jgi:hypothetical protein
MKNYWFCIIGPVERSDIPYGGDFPLRMAVKAKFGDMFPNHDQYSCSSSWGITEEDSKQMSFAKYDDITKKLLIQSYYNENLKLPRHMRAWELLLNEESEESDENS